MNLICVVCSKYASEAILHLPRTPISIDYYQPFRSQYTGATPLHPLPYFDRPQELIKARGIVRPIGPVAGFPLRRQRLSNQMLSMPFFTGAQSNYFVSRHGVVRFIRGRTAGDWLGGADHFEPAPW